MNKVEMNNINQVSRTRVSQTQVSLTQDSMLKIGDAADYLGVSKKTLYHWDKNGKFKAYRNPMNNYKLYKVSRLQELKAKLENSEYNPDIVNTK